MKRLLGWTGSLIRIITRGSSSRIAARALFFFSLPCASPVFAHCQFIPASTSLWVRLVDPVASYSSKPGTTLRAVLIESPECDASPVFPVGIEVDGRVISVRKVGLGFIHDTARLQIQFDRLVTSGGPLPMASMVAEVHNARETVRDGIIHGIRSTDTPQGRITSGLVHLPTYNPYSDMGLVVYRTFTVLPEPEIYLPSGTDLRLRLSEPLYVGDQPELPELSAQLDGFERADIEQLLEQVPERTATSSGQDADVVNLLLVGSQDQVASAFAAAGWLPADRNSFHAFLKEFEAFLTLNNYPNMPVSRQFLGGQMQDSSWQKILNSYGKRDHLRVWSQTRFVLGQQAWLGAYTRDTSAVLSVRRHKFIHHIDPNLDAGVKTLVRDLTLSGCVDTVYHLPRPDIPRNLVNSTGDAMRTDGMLTVIQLNGCSGPAVRYSAGASIPARPHSRIVRYFRNEVLLYKSSVIRGNMIYSTFDLCRMSIHSLHHRNGAPIEPDDPPLSSVAP